MFHGTIVNGRKGPAVFWESRWGMINSTSYNERILSGIQAFFQEYVEERYIFIHDNADAHRSLETRMNLLDRGIRYVPFPLYSPDFNLIEHVWNWMKNWI